MHHNIKEYVLLTSFTNFAAHKWEAGEDQHRFRPQQGDFFFFFSQQGGFLSSFFQLSEPSFQEISHKQYHLRMNKQQTII